MNIQELREEYPEAFEALPEPYKADSCLIFNTKCDGTLFAFPASDQINVLGDWMSEFIDGKWVIASYGYSFDLSDL